jgi:phenylpyruvate tautomerase PptA (4-oxalocrotonate tautomerase family)
MPSTLIESRRPYTPEAAEDLMNAVHQALVDAFRIPAHDRTVRLLVHARDHFLCPPDKADPDVFTHITIDCFAGRSVGAKRALYRAIVGRLEPLGIPSDHVTVVLRESPPENWGIRGGQAACDVNLGFKVDV